MSVHGGSQTTVFGRERGGQDSSKKKTKKEQKIAKIVIHRLCVTKRATEAFGSRNNTEYFLSDEATTLNTSWMKQNLVICS